MSTWRVVIILAATQFVMVLDTTVMNVAISDIVADLDTSVAGVQLAIAAYTLVMAALMLIGGKVGDLIGRRRAFTIGLAVYAIGSGTTAISPNLPVLLFGWSLLEGIGAALVIPAIAALVAGNYKWPRRAAAFAIMGGVAAGGGAAGPLIGGAITTAASWRYVFMGEVVLIVVILLCTRILGDLARTGPRPALDGVGATLSAVGMAVTVGGFLQASTWGWITPRNPPRIGDQEITPFGISPVPFVVMVGIAIMIGFLAWERRLLGRGGEPLVRPSLLAIPRLRAGLTTAVLQQAYALGALFVLPLYLQVVVGKDALETGVALLPLASAMLLVAFGATRLSTRVSPRTLIRTGWLTLAAGTFGLMGTLDRELTSAGFGVALAVVGIGLGLIASQLGNVNLSSVDETRSGEVGGLQGTAQNLGASIGTALIGAILLSGLGGALQSRVTENPAVAEPVKAQIAAAAQQGIDFVPSDQARAAAIGAGLPADQADALVTNYEDAQLVALKMALLFAAVLALGALLATRHLPDRPERAPGPAEQPVAA